jgi:hypothetical protein
MPREISSPKVSSRSPTGSKSNASDSARLAPLPRSTAAPLGAPGLWRPVVIAALAVGAVSFLATELMHYILVPDIGRSPERLLAEGFSALLVALLTAKLALVSRERQRLMTARMQVISEMNHHIRNALSPLSLALDGAENRQLQCVISDAVDRIDWALREILPRETPLGDEQRHKLGYFQSRRTFPQ